MTQTEGPIRYYDEQIEAAGGIDLQLLGIGRNGHIGLTSPVRHSNRPPIVGRLTEMTRQDNSRFFDSVEEVPPLAVTQGIGTILKSRKAILMAFGEGLKADAIRDSLAEPPAEQRPGSGLQLHSDCVFYLMKQPPPRSTAKN